MQKLTQFCKSVASKRGLKFALRSKLVDVDEVFSDVGLLPALLKRADQLCMLCFGVSSGALYSEDEKSILGTRVRIEDHVESLPMGVYACMLDTMLEIARGERNGRIDMDELLYD